MTLLATRFDAHDGKRVRVAELPGPGPESAGSAAPPAPIVCLHGYPDNLQIFARLLPELARDRRAIAFDWPGLGDSDAWTGGASPHQMAERLVRLLDAWKIAAAYLVGLDMGGQPALAAAAKHPERVAGVVVTSSLVAPAARTSWELRLLRSHGLNRRILRHLPRAVFARAEATFLGRGEHLDADVRADMWRCFARKTTRAFLVRMCAGYEAGLPRLATSYETITVPVLALWPERDPHFPVEHADLLARAIPRARVEIVPGARHWMPFSRAGDVAARVLRFVNERRRTP